MKRGGSAYAVSLRQRVSPPPFRGAALKALVRRALAGIGCVAADVRIAVVGDEEMKRWNIYAFGKPHATNVISFPEDELSGRDTARIAGDILISAPTCLKQTHEWPGTPEERVLFFLVHGMLHLSGYDHERGRVEAIRMRRRESEVYRSVVGKERL